MPQPEFAPKTMFILFDGRAKFGDTDDAAVMDTADSLREAWNSSRQAWRDVDAIWYEVRWSERQRCYIEIGPRFDIGKGVLL